MGLNLNGLIPATIVPMDVRGDIDEPALRQYLRWVSAQGPVALAINADTGETTHLSHAERLRVLEIAKEESSVPCVCGLSGPATHNALSYARDFRAAGADALLVFPVPAYLSTPLDPQIPLRYHQAIASVGLPMILFQLQPALGGFLFDQDLLRQLLAIDGVIGMKEASFDARRFVDVVQTMRSNDPSHSILNGNDNFLIESFVLGATGALVGFGAIMTSQQTEMIRAWQKGRNEDALALGERVQRLADVVFAAPIGQYRARIKECLKLIGVLEQAHVRLPLLPISNEERLALHATLVEVGLLPV